MTGRGKRERQFKWGPKASPKLPKLVTGPFLAVPKLCKAPHTAFIWDRVKFLQSISYGAENSIVNTGIC